MVRVSWLGAALLMLGCVPAKDETTGKQLSQLCVDLRTEACRPERATVAAADLLTVVLTDLSAGKPELAKVMEGIASVPPALKREAFKREVSVAVGESWECPELEVLWDEQRPQCGG